MTRRLAVALGGLGLLGATVLGAGPAPAATTPDAEVRVQGQAYELARGSIKITVRSRCAADLRVSRLSLVYSQGDVTGPTELATPPACTGGWQRQTASSVEGFDPGPAEVVATMTLVDAATGAPRGTVSQTMRVYVRPAAKILLPRTAELRAHGVVRIVVRARCDQPWTPGDWTLDASQGQAGDSELLTLVCDGLVHRVVVHLRSGAARFVTGRLLVSSTLTVFDEFFDPVAQATASRDVEIVRPGPSSA
jgi:hypothetical protein